MSGKILLAWSLVGSVLIVALLGGCADVGQVARPDQPVRINGKAVQLEVGDWVMTDLGFLYEVMPRYRTAGIEEVVLPKRFVEVRRAERRRMAANVLESAR